MASARADLRRELGDRRGVDDAAPDAIRLRRFAVTAVSGETHGGSNPRRRGSQTPASRVAHANHAAPTDRRVSPKIRDRHPRTGVPSRAEVTDAATSVAAECVMLNKGPFIDEAVRVLSNILRRMEKHHDKKRSLFRKLQVSTFVAR